MKKIQGLRRLMTDMPVLILVGIVGLAACVDAAIGSATHIALIVTVGAMLLNRTAIADRLMYETHLMAAREEMLRERNRNGSKTLLRFVRDGEVAFVVTAKPPAKPRRSDTSMTLECAIEGDDVEATLVRSQVRLDEYANGEVHVTIEGEGWTMPFTPMDGVTIIRLGPASGIGGQGRPADAEGGVPSLGDDGNPFTAQARDIIAGRTPTTRADLTRLRREVSMAVHPDRGPPAERAMRTAAIQAANAHLAAMGRRVRAR